MERLKIITRGLLTPTGETWNFGERLKVVSRWWRHQEKPFIAGLYTKTLHIGSKVFLNHITEALESTVGA